ncbi:MAG TPA: hypothetical protein VES20_14750 [Bryobacteraceae bacterium]|nr:hypothetical protein [Bryobacteraceae bacterium]
MPYTEVVREEYEQRLGSRLEAARRHEAAFGRIGTLRLLVVVAGAALAWWNFWLLPLPVALFAALIIWHERVARRASHDARAAAWYHRGLARLDYRWAEAGETGERFRSAEHLYADDLDLFGRGSLFQLINTARTAEGEAKLAQWLLAPASPDEVRARHTAVQELCPRLDLREDLALLGDDVRAGLHASALLRWGKAPAVGVRPAHRLTAAALAACMLISFSGYMLQLWPLTPVLVTLLAELLLFAIIRQRVMNILSSVDVPGRDLRVLAELLGRFEREKFASGRLAELRARITTEGMQASEQIRRLRRLIELREQAHNQMFALIAEPVLWSPQFAFAIERWRIVSGPHIGDWIEAVGELEALCSLASYAAEHPQDPFPELEGSPEPLFEATAIAHPLIPEGVAVRNDICLGMRTRLLLISGSNMSGKSTLLRSVGLNAALAQAGAPVRAARLRLSPLLVGASLRTQDSVLEGKSRFYAEITRLRQVVDLANGAAPCLFLLDEVLSGTNSHDRLIGARAIVRTLAARGGIGLVTTHDLALAHIAEELRGAVNVHFEDHIENGEVAFDYRMREGIVRKSNALELMRSVGLEV